MRVEPHLNTKMKYLIRLWLFSKMGFDKIVQFLFCTICSRRVECSAVGTFFCLATCLQTL